MFFKEVIGQSATKERLIQSVQRERVSHAQLFAGPEGTGKLALAIAYAQYVACTNRQASDSCGECPSCKKFRKLIHPDLHFVFPVIKTKKFDKPVSDNFIEEWRQMIGQNPYFTSAQWFDRIGVENAQGLIYAHQSEEIIRKLNLKSYESEYKVMIIWLPEKMHVSCANKLLKMIEEPPMKTLFVLITENEEDIISTIRSRCQLITIPPIEAASLEKAIAEVPEAEGLNIKNIVHLAKGSYSKALELLQPDEQTQFNLERFKELMRSAYGRKFTDLFKWVDQLSGIGREKQKSLLNYCLVILRENFIYNLKNKNLSFMNEQEVDFSKRFSPFINERNIIELTEVFETAFNHIGMNGNPKIIFTDVAFKITKLIRK
ncbi:MAG TPA: DNA polymerase III subunit delta' [Prolixibacteraceae bacterium]|jgi:DNA polymerase-3 subunit delta'|nr:DNA polymerase III subunit delta' [Prolixibacteraceae bacterium]